jgi:prepilin-type N-terminal cleavage/methylation domain-containing protein
VRRGYTLIELIVVLFALSLAAAVAAPAVGRGLASLRLRAEVAGIASFLRAARERAITGGVTTEIALDSEGQALVREPGHAVKRLSEGLRLISDPPDAQRVRFLPEGITTGGRFQLEVPDARGYVVTVEPLTGRVVMRRSDR